MNNMQSDNTQIILSEILEPLRMAGDAVDIYFDRADDREILSPFPPGGITGRPGKNETLPPEFFKGFGIHRLILDAPHGRLSVSEEDLKTIFENSRVVEFENWSDVKDASQIWDNLRRDIIHPLRKRDVDFVFYLGDANNKLKFKVDEFLDIVCDFSGCGRVTMIMDERNVDDLLEMFYERETGADISILPGLPEKSRTVFDLVNIEHLIAGSFSEAVFFYKQQQFEIKGPKGVDTSMIKRSRFSAGYMLGLLLQVDISHSIALGLAVAGLYTEIGNKPDTKNLIDFIEKWIGELESLTQIYSLK
ncbi:MAG TPA: hypothetical protein VGH64_09980 [Puia sp.]